MPYSDPERQKEANLRAQHKRRGMTEGMTEASLSHPEVSHPEVPGIDGQPKSYDPGTDGVDGWHTTDKGMKYILQDTGMGGMARRYSPGPRMFSYR